MDMDLMCPKCGRKFNSNWKQPITCYCTTITTTTTHTPTTTTPTSTTITPTSNTTPTTPTPTTQPAPTNHLQQHKDRATICLNCKYRVPKGCALYVRPCTVKQLWADQIPPPEKCPNKELFNEN